MKEWKNPEIQDLDINTTAYAPQGGYTPDGVYESKDGKYTLTTYGPSTGNSGVPGVEVGEE